MNAIDKVRDAVAEAMRPCQFFVRPPLELHWTHELAETAPWEIFRGRLVSRQLTREMATCETWNAFEKRDGQFSEEPLLSLKLDVAQEQLHIVRGILCYTWEGYDAGNNVYLSREVPRWQRELVGTVALKAIGPELTQSLALWLFRAVVGLSRLPLTSAESPLPAFTLGELAYFWGPDSQLRDPSTPIRSWRELATRYSERGPAEVKTKWLEFLLRATPAEEVEDMAGLFAKQHPRGCLTLLRAVFNDVSLSPYTDFVDKTLAFVRLLEKSGFLEPASRADFLAHLLCQLARHLTAYDLVSFHHRGANYPDALLLDSALKELLVLIEDDPRPFTGDAAGAKRRRRALRQGWLQRRRWEGHPVPDAPTSPGENARVLPAPHVRVPEEQILQGHKRRKRLYDGDPLTRYLGAHGRSVMAECGLDLCSAEEVRELGMAVFIERPLGATKSPGEPDLSPLLAHEAFSRSVAERALAELAREPLFGLTATDASRALDLLNSPWPEYGIRADSLPTEPPRVVSLADAVKAAADFVIVRTLPSSVRTFLEYCGINGLDPREKWLIVYGVTTAGMPGVLVYDAEGKVARELETSQ
jgi:hypothetical protein